MTETFFPVSEERAAVIVHPPGVEGQQLVEVGEVVVAREEEVEVVHVEAETEAELSDAVEPVDEEAAVQEFAFQDCEAGHQPGPGPGPGPGPSLGPFCSDILSWSIRRTLVTRLGVSERSRNLAASWKEPLSDCASYFSRYNAISNFPSDLIDFSLSIIRVRTFVRLCLMFRATRQPQRGLSKAFGLKGSVWDTTILTVFHNDV